MIRLAYVLDNADPEGLARVTVGYLGHEAGAQSDWAPVATPLAGAEAGLFTLPEPGDLVAVGFIADDLNQPIVLGALWNGMQAPPAEKASERRFVSRTGHALTLSDGDDDGIAIEDSHGNRIVMNADGITIEAAGDLKLSASGTITIEAAQETTVIGSTVQLNP